MYPTKKTIQFCDCDPAGVIYFGRIFDLAHKVYEEFLIEKGIASEIFSSNECIFPIISASSKYYKPIRHMDQINILLTIPELRKASFELNFQFLDVKNELCAVVSTVHVCILKLTGEKTNLSTKLSAVLSLLNMKFE